MTKRTKMSSQASDRSVDVLLTDVGLATADPGRDEADELLQELADRLAEDVETDVQAMGVVILFGDGSAGMCATGTPRHAYALAGALEQLKLRLLNGLVTYPDK